MKLQRREDIYQLERFLNKYLLLGCSGFRIDLGVIDPSHRGHFILGVECDGRYYHSALTARERDRIRQEILENLGWRIHRIWSPDWFYSRKEAIQRLKLAIEEVRTNDNYIDNNKNKHKIELYYSKNIQENSRQDSNDVYRYYKGKNKSPSYEFNSNESFSKIKSVLTEIVKMESPIHNDLAIKRLTSIWDIERIGPNIQMTANKAIKHCENEGSIFKREEFLWSNSNYEITNARRPDEFDKETFRDLEYVCQEEIRLAIKSVVDKALNIDKNALFIEIGRFFGWKRNTKYVGETISKAFNYLLEEQIIVFNADTISPITLF